MGHHIQKGETHQDAFFASNGCTDEKYQLHRVVDVKNPKSGPQMSFVLSLAVESKEDRLHFARL